MDGNIKISIDKLPIKRLDAIEENGSERFPSDVDYDENRLNLIRRIDFGWAVEREDPSKKQKSEGTTTSKDSKTTNQQPGQWQSLVENLQLARQELSVIIDLINTVEANDAVTVAGMTRPKQLPNEILSDLAVSTATKLQCFRHLGKYFKQSATALEQQVAREARFYGALIRLQHNWKVKRHRSVAAASGNKGFYIDLFYNTLNDTSASLRPSSMSTIPIEHDTAGMLAVNLPPNSCHSLRFEFLGSHFANNMRRIGETNTRALSEDSTETMKEHANDDECVRETHSLLREVHRAIFDEQVFELISYEACNSSLSVNLTGIQENYLSLSINQGASVSISLLPSSQDNKTDCGAGTNSSETETLPSELLDGSKFGEGKDNVKKLGFPNRISFEIYLQQLFNEYVFVKAKNKTTSSVRSQISGQQSKDNLNILDHFCMSLAHRIFSNKVLSELEYLVCKTPYVQLISHHTWHSRTSSWTLSMKVPQSILHAGSQIQSSGANNVKNVKSQFWTKVVVIDESISVQGEGNPNVVGLFNGKPEITCPINRYECDLADLPIILLQQVASQVIQWLHEEALSLGIKVNRDFLSLAFELDHGEIASLVAHVDPEDTIGCISWWLMIDDGLTEDLKLHPGLSIGESESRKFLGHLSLNVLYSTLLDFVNLCSC
ncbi:mediator of RNA polymerase II transcription subunit 17-like [Olea europaea var. sylvestris]|uniref:mediator of RNA polymerase II transcription subunit 17-like n=1 Tax=Olea europaea var. sylvestris TaxID=158386 RepID=UPI000C1D29BF|nr:mediator of RNA polymerase II transcription subunit 17-like [Olea europaea var. sylvestris]